MSDVESGGYTVFMKANAIVKPVKVLQPVIYFTILETVLLVKRPA
jgi:hypothetical protein